MIKKMRAVVSNEITYSFIPRTFIEHLTCVWAVLGAEHVAVNVAGAGPLLWEGHGGRDPSA